MSTFCIGTRGNRHAVPGVGPGLPSAFIAGILRAAAPTVSVIVDRGNLPVYERFLLHQRHAHRIDGNRAAPGPAPCPLLQRFKDILTISLTGNDDHLILIPHQTVFLFIGNPLKRHVKNLLRLCYALVKGKGCGTVDGPRTVKMSGPPSGSGTNFMGSRQVIRGSTSVGETCR